MSHIYVRDLRQIVAGVIAREKAYNVPALCVRLGLADGDESEAMSSKSRYASSRLAKLSQDQLIKVANDILSEGYDFLGSSQHGREQRAIGLVANSRPEARSTAARAHLMFSLANASPN